MKQKEKEIKTKYMNQKHSLPPLLKRGTGVRPYLTTNCMKTLTRFLIIPMLSVAFFSCSESHFLKDVAYRNQVTQDFEMKKQQLPNGELFAVFNEKLTIPEQEALMFLYAYMPTGDVTDYTGDYYLENVRLSDQARREMPWGKEIPDDVFRHFVLPIRVNNVATKTVRSSHILRPLTRLFNNRFQVPTNCSDFISHTPNPSE